MNVVFHDENSHAIGTPFHGGAQHGKPSAALSARKPLGNITNSSLQNVSFGVSQKDQVFGKSKAAASGAPREKPAGWWVEKPKPTTDEAFQRRRKRLDALCENPPEKAFGLTWEQQEERRLQTVDLEVSNRWRGIVQSWNMGPRMAESTGEVGLFTDLFNWSFHFPMLKRYLIDPFCL